MTFAQRTLALAAAIGAVSPAAAQNPYFMSPQQAYYQSLQSAAARGQNPWLNGAANPYSPYTSVSPSAIVGASPYAPAPVIGPYSPYGYGWGPGFGLGSIGAGQAMELQAYGQVVMNQEQARILREQAMQAKIDTARKRFDFDLYVKANTPTYAEEQKKIARNTLKRIQYNSNPSEIVSGKALNVLMDDVRLFPLKKANMDPIPMSEEVLNQLNVTTKTFGVGMLRDAGKFTWPVVLADILPPDQMRAIDKQVQIAVANAAAGKIDQNVLADIGLRMEEVKKALAKKVNDIPTGKYLDADRFLSDFRDARQGLEDGQMAVQAKFTNFVKGGKSIQEVADYLVANGLKFAPASTNDEAGYRALHSALVAFDVALNTAPPQTAEDKGPPAQ